MGLDSIVDVSITTQTTNPARAGFGVPLLVSYFPTSLFSDRTRLYTSLSGMIADGFLTTDAAYLMAVALKAQNPSVKEWKVGRRAGAAVQTLRLTPTITTEGEVLRVTIEGTEIAYTIPAAATVASICTAMTALIAAVTGVTCSDDTTHMTITPKNVASAKLTVDGVANSKAYTVTIDGVDFTYTSDTDATATEIRDGLQALIIAGGYAAAEVVDSSTDALTFAFASHAGADLRESAEAGASMALSLEVLANRLLSVGGLSTGLTIKDNTPNPATTIQTDLAAILVEDADWYGLAIDSESEAQILAAAAWAETQRCIFGASTIDTEVKTSATTDVGSDLKAAGYARTYLIQAEYNSQYAGLRWMGKLFPKDPGSATWCYKQLAGNTVSSLSAAQEGYLNSKNVNHYTTVGGVAVTQKGYSASGEFIDITHGVDWFRARLQERIYGLLINNDKIPYEVAGDLFRAQILAQLEEGRKAGVIASDTEDTPWTISIPTVGELSASDKAARLYPDIEFSAYLAGAVHTLEIQGTLSA
jgi:hypothetical protein